MYFRLLEAEALEAEFMGLDEAERHERLVTGGIQRILPVTAPTEGAGGRQHK